MPHFYIIHKTKQLQNLRTFLFFAIFQLTEGQSVGEVLDEAEKTQEDGKKSDSRRLYAESMGSRLRRKHVEDHPVHC